MLHDDEADVGVRVTRWQHHVATQRRMTAWLVEHPLADVVEMALEILRLVEHRVTGDVRHAADDHPARLAAGVHINGVDTCSRTASLPPIAVDPQYEQPIADRAGHDRHRKSTSQPNDRPPRRPRHAMALRECRLYGARRGARTMSVIDPKRRPAVVSRVS